MQVVLTKDHVSVPWGFRLKGGAEYNVPLSILKVNESSPAQFKLENGDVIVTIGQYQALNLKHEEALNIIRLFDVTLPLTIRRGEPTFNTSQLPAKSTSSVGTWRPSHDQPASYALPANFESVYAHYGFDQSYIDSLQPQLVENPPEFQIQQERKSGLTSVSQLVQAQESRSTNAHIPDALVKALNGPPMSVKPFTYTPGGLDLSHIRESSRVKRYEPTSPSSADFYQNSRTQTPSFIQQQQQQQHQQLGSPGQNYQQFIHQQQHQPHHLQYEQQQAQQQFQHSYEHQQQTRALQQSSFFNQAPVQAQKSRAQSPLSVNVNMPQDYDSFLNASNTPSAAQKLAMRPVKPVTKPITPAPGFNITPQQIVRPKKKEDAKDLANQSYSFRMLNKWIEDSEATSQKPLEMIRSDQETITAQATQLNVKKTEVLIAVEEEEKKQRKLQMLHASRAKDGNSSVPSKVFKFIDRKYSTDYFEYPNVSVNGQPEQTAPSTPASQRHQESGISKYRGVEIPSKSFKQLQQMTQEAEQEYRVTHPQPVVVQAEPEPVAVVATEPAENVLSSVQEQVLTEIVNNVQIEVSSNVESSPTEDVAQPESFSSSANEITNEAFVNQTESEPQPDAPSEQPAEQQSEQIEAQIEAVVSSIENLTLPEPVAEQEPSQPEPQPEPEPEPVPEPVPEPQPEPVPEQQPESQISNEATPVQPESNEQAQDKNETSDF